MNGFLPISKQDMTDRGWYYCDFLIVTGDAYVDHPSFGTAIISRVLEDAGYKDGEITFEMGYDSSASANNQMVCQIIQQQLAAVGINMEIKTYDQSSWLATRKAGEMDSFVGT